MTSLENTHVTAPCEGGGTTESPALANEVQLIDQKKADLVLLIEVLTDFSYEEHLVTQVELLQEFITRASQTPPLTTVDIEAELSELPDPRFEGPSSAEVAEVIQRAKDMKEAQPGSSPDPEVPGLRKTRRLIKRRELLTSLLDKARAVAGTDKNNSPEKAEPEEHTPQIEVSQNAPSHDQEASSSSAVLRVVELAYAEELLAHLLSEDEDVATITSWDEKEYYYYKPQLSTMYAKILASNNNKLIQLATIVRDSSRDYPRPVPVEIFEYPPFFFEAEEIQSCLKTMAEDQNYQDIKFTESSVGTVYLYSTTFLDDDYASFLAEHEDTGAISSP